MLQSLSPTVSLFLFALTPAICEEALFRGLILRSLLRRFPAGISILIASLLFGLFHGTERLLPTATLGVLLALVTWRSGSLWPAVILHALNNAILVLLAQSGKDEAFDHLTGGVQALAFAGSIVLVLLGVVMVCSRVPTEKTSQVAESA